MQTPRLGRHVGGQGPAGRREAPDRGERLGAPSQEGQGSQLRTTGGGLRAALRDVRSPAGPTPRGRSPQRPVTQETGLRDDSLLIPPLDKDETALHPSSVNDSLRQ